MAKWWQLLIDFFRAWLNFDDARGREKIQARAEAEAELHDWGGQIAQEVKDNVAEAHQEIEATRDVDGGRAAALRRLKRLRRGSSGPAAGGD